MKFERGFTVIELVVGMAVFGILIGVVALNLNTARTQATLSTTFEILITDLNQQQLKAMVGDTEGRTESDTYGIHFEGDTYTLFHGTYSSSEPSNISLSLPDGHQVTTTFPDDAIIFERGSGEIVGYDADEDTITLQDTQSGEQRTLEMNQYGVIEAVN